MTLHFSDKSRFKGTMSLLRCGNMSKICDSPADRGHAYDTVERERDKQARGADTTPTKQPLQGTNLMQLDHLTGLSHSTEPANMPPPPDTFNVSGGGGRLAGRRR